MLFFLERILFAQLFIEARVRYYIVMYGHVEEKKVLFTMKVSISMENKIFQNINKTVEIMVCFCCRTTNTSQSDVLRIRTCGMVAR